MGYEFCDARGYLSDGPSISGLRDLRTAISAHTESRVLDEFFTHGYTDTPAQLADDLAPLVDRNVLPAPVRSSLVSLIAAARRADATLILTDGVGVDFEETP